jgi:(p)ppGpp synthase/HD superfamily hydrolase
MYTERMVEQAIACSKFCHRDQLDKNGSPYISHPMRLVENSDTNAKKILSALHDCLEDQPAKLIEFIKSELNSDIELDCSTETALWLVSLFFGPEISEALDAISHRKNEERELYYMRVKQDPLAHSVKLLDIGDNTDPKRLLLLDADTQARLIKKYDKAIACLTL